jgi:hypothetical protein
MWYFDYKIAPFGHPAVMVGTELLIFCIWLFLSVLFPVTFTPQGSSKARHCLAKLGETLTKLCFGERVLTWSAGVSYSDPGVSGTSSLFSAVSKRPFQVGNS